MNKRTLFFTLALATAQGCSWIPSVGPDYEAPELDVPAAWRSQPGDATSNAAALPAEWWRTLEDPALDQIVLRSLERNNSLEAARSRLRQARYIRLQAIAPFLPNASLGTSYSRIRRSQSELLVAGGSTRDPEQDLYEGGFDASWEIDIFGGSRRGYEAAEAENEAAAENLRDAQVSLIAEVVRNYYEFLSLEKRVSIAEKNLSAQDESAKIVRARFDAGLSSELDLAQALAQLETTRATVPALRSALDASINSLAVLLNETPLSIAPVLNSTAKPSSESSIASTLPADFIPPTPADVLRRRPDVRSAERQLAASSARIGAALGELFPRLTLSGSFGFQSSSSSFIDAANRVWSFGPGISVPIFAGGRLWNEVRIQREQNTQALQAYEQTVVQALAEADSAIAAFHHEHERFTALGRAVESSRRALELSRDLYRQGLVDFQRVLDSERATFAAEDQLAQSENEILAGVARVYKAFGFGADSVSTDAERVSEATLASSLKP